ncbi:ATP-binding protein [bacterium]|nr:ATP-binding protein [bacterium]
MRPFSSIAHPHRDILEGRLELNIFAADLWEVFKGRGPDEYRDPDLFFRRTYLTRNLKELLNMAQKRLSGQGGDPIIQLQTPFGGGKTHSLIALYHKAQEWGTKRFVFVGDKIGVGESDLTPWEELEMQLEGKVEKLKGKISPGGERLRQILEKHQPIIILLDELHEYAVKASGIKIESATLATQVLLFIQELTGTVSKLEKAIMFVSLPSSNPYENMHSEELLQALQSILGRMEKIYAPVEEEEVAEVIRRRLFSSIDIQLAKEEIDNFLDYVEREGFLPTGMDKSTYRERFLKTYPFQPEVIDVLYHRWGSFPTFQRTRGALRLLALVIASIYKKPTKSFISLSDFDLSNSDIKGELVKHIGSEYDSIISADIAGSNSGAKRVDESLGASYLPYAFGTKCATTIFMYSFPPGRERGASINQVKLSCAIPEVPSSIIVEAVEKLRQNLFYLSDEGLFFTNTPNLNRIFTMEKERVEKRELEEAESEILKRSLSNEPLRSYLYPENSSDIPDDRTLKLAVLKDKSKAKEMWENCGARPRVYRNTLFFLCPYNSARAGFEDYLRGLIAWRRIKSAENLQLTPGQRGEVERRLREMEGQRYEQIRRLYRILLIPRQGGLEEKDLGVPIVGGRENLTGEVYETLRADERILERITPQFLFEKYLKDKEYLSTKDLLESFYRTPGEIILKNEEVLREAIREGVREKLFGLGKLEDSDKPDCKFFGNDCSPNLGEGELIVSEKICVAKSGGESVPPKTDYDSQIEQANNVSELKVTYQTVNSDTQLSESEKKRLLKKTHYKMEILETPSDDTKKLEKMKEEISADETLTQGDKDFLIQKIQDKIKPPSPPTQPPLKEIYLKLQVPFGKLSDVIKMVNLIKSKYEQLEMFMEVKAKQGEGMTNTEYENLKEGLRQAGVDIIIEEKQKQE